MRDKQNREVTFPRSLPIHTHRKTAPSLDTCDSLFAARHRQQPQVVLLQSVQCGGTCEKTHGYDDARQIVKAYGRVGFIVENGANASVDSVVCMGK